MRVVNLPMDQVGLFKTKCLCRNSKWRRGRGIQASETLRPVEEKHMFGKDAECGG